MSTKKLIELFEKFSELYEVEKSRGDDKKFHDLHTSDMNVTTGYGYDPQDNLKKDVSRKADLRKGQDKNIYKKVQKDDEKIYPDDIVNTKKTKEMRFYNEEKDGVMTKDEDPCWKGYRMYGFKIKNGKKVPNCVKVED